MTLKGHYALCFKTHASFAAHHENLNFMRVFAGFPYGDGTSNDSGVVENAQFSVISLAIPSITLDMRSALLYSDTQSIVGFSAIPKMHDRD